MSRHRTFFFACAAVLVVTGSQPALGDAATPTNYRSEVTAQPPSVTAEVVGGDSFLRLTVPPEIDAVILGYEGEPYLRFFGDGRVGLNRHSPATYLNDDRYASAEVPAHAQASAEPDWIIIAEAGTWAWHDHRIHWMSRTPAPAVGDGSAEVRVLDWSVPVVVNGSPGEITGTLSWIPDRSPLPWLAAGLLAALGTLMIRRQVPILTIAGLLALGAGLATVPHSPGAGPFQIDIIAPATALALIAYPRRVSRQMAAALLAAWGIGRYENLLRPELPTVLPDWSDRLITALVLGAAAGLAVDLMRMVSSGDTEKGLSARGPE